MVEERKTKALSQEPTLEAQERLIEIMNDSPRIKSFNGTQWEVRALKPGTQWLIAQEAVKIQKEENSSFGDVIKCFSTNIPSVARVLTLCLLNDRKRIFDSDRKYSEEFNNTYDTILWDTDQKFWIELLVEFLSMLDVEVFFSTTASIQILRQSLLGRKTTMEEQKRLLQERNMGK